MNKTPNFILITISNLLFCFILILISAFLIFSFDLECLKFISYLCILLVGISSGISSSRSENKKLIYSLISSTIFFIIYFAISFFMKSEIINLYSYIIVAINLYLGTFIGCILTVNQKKTKGRFKK